MNEQENINTMQQQMTPDGTETYDYFKTPKYLEREERKGFNHIGKALIFQLIITFAIPMILNVIAGIYVGGIAVQKHGINVTEADIMAILAPMLPFIIALSLVLSTLIANTIPFMICAKKIKEGFWKMFKPGVFNFKTIALTCVVCLGVNFLSYYIVVGVSWLLELINIVPSTPSFGLGDSSLTNILMLISVCILAPITEELVFRGVLLRFFCRKGEVFGVIVTAAMFALIHGNIAQSVGAFFIGLVFGIIAIKTKSILIPIIGHFFNNSFAMMQEYFLYKDLDGYLVAAEIFMATCAVATVIIGIIMIIKRKKQNELNPPAPKVKHNGVKLIFTSWSMLIWIAVYTVFMFLTMSGILQF